MINLENMYPASINSISTTITGAIGTADTVIFVLDDSRIPEPPNLLVLGENSTQAETVKLTAKDGNKLTVIRGFQSAARAWNEGTTIARNFTAYDHDAFAGNIRTLAAEQEAHKIAAMPHFFTGENETLYNWGFRIDSEGSLIFVYEEVNTNA